MPDARPNAMRFAIEEAQIAASEDEVPVGAVLLNQEGDVIARARNAMRSTCDPTAHAEILALRQAARIISAPFLYGCDLYVTLEPCAMCAAAISHARLRRLYYGAPDPKGGAVEHGVRFFHSASCHHAPEHYGGIQERQCGKILKDFFAARR